MKTFALASAVFVLLVRSAPALADEDISDIVRTKGQTCHGADGKANTEVGKEHNMNDLSNPRWHSAHTDDDIRDAITNGVPKTKMKAYKKKLTAAQIEALVKWVRGLSPPRQAE